jgi:hypothetical protein
MASAPGTSTLRGEMAVSGRSLLAATGQVLLTAHRSPTCTGPNSRIRRWYPSAWPGVTAPSRRRSVGWYFVGSHRRTRGPNRTTLVNTACADCQGVRQLVRRYVRRRGAPGRIRTCGLPLRRRFPLVQSVPGSPSSRAFVRLGVRQVALRPGVPEEFGTWLSTCLEPGATRPVLGRARHPWPTRCPPLGARPEAMHPEPQSDTTLGRDRGGFSRRGDQTLSHTPTFALDVEVGTAV